MRLGIVTTSTMFRYHSKSLLEPKAEVAISTNLALFETSCRTIFYKYFHYLRWSDQYPSLPKTFEMKKYEYYEVYLPLSQRMLLLDNMANHWMASSQVTKMIHQFQKIHGVQP